MLKMHRGYDDARQAHQLLFGFSEGNLIKLREGQPILVRGAELLLPAVDFVFQYGRDKAAVRALVDDACGHMGVGERDRVSVLHVAGTFYVFPLDHRTENRVALMVFFDNAAYAVLRSRNVLTFRSRVLGEQAQSVELTMFWRPTEEIMEEEFAALGITKEKK